MKLQEDLRYTKSHEWLKEEGDTALVGISDHAQEALGDIVFVNLPEVGDRVEVGESFAEVESVKAVSDVYSPVSGVVSKVNEELLDAPEKINEDPYGSWFIEVVEVSEVGEVLSSVDYQTVVEEEA